MEKLISRTKKKLIKIEPEKRQALLSQFNASNLTQVAFARKHGIKYSTFSGWVKRHKNSEKTRADKNINFVEVSFENKPQEIISISARYKIIFADNVELQFSEATAEAEALINHLRRQRC